MIPYARHEVTEEDIAAVVEVLRSDRLTQGPVVERFEAALCEATRARYAVAVSSGTAALEAIFHGLDRRGAEVVMPAMTFPATANAALWAGWRLVFADIERETACLSARCAERLCGPQTAALLAMDYAGHPAAWHELHRIARPRGLVLIADACHSLGAVLDGLKVGEYADIAALSFHAAKVITTGEGGAVVTSNALWAECARRFRDQGYARGAEVAAGPGRHHGEQWVLGHNYRMTEMQAALGLAQLRRLPQILERRRQIAARYSEHLAPVEGLVLPREREGARSAWHLYAVRYPWAQCECPGLTRERAMGLVREAGVETQIHYAPVYQHPYYRLHVGAGPEWDAIRETEGHYRECLTLPLYPSMTDADVDFVAHALIKIIDGGK